MLDAETRIRRMEQVLEISADLTSTIALKPLLHKIVDVAAELLQCEIAAILLLDESSGELRFVTARTLADRLVSIPVPIDGSIAGAALTSGQCQVVPDARNDPRHFKVVDQQIGLETRSLLAVPLQFKERRIGILEAGNKQNGAVFDSDDVETLSLLATQAAIAIENARLVEALQTSREELAAQIGERDRLLEAEREQRKLAEALSQASAALGSTLDYNQVVDQILEQIDRFVPQAAANIMLIESQGTDEAPTEKMVRVFRGHGYEQFGAAEGLTSIPFKLSDVAGLLRIQRTGQPLVIPNVEHDKEWVYSRPEHSWIKSYAGVPIRIRNEIIGFLNVNSAVPGFFTEEDTERLQAFADHAAIAIENARLYKQAQQRLIEREQAENALREHRDHLEDLVKARTAELEKAIERMKAEIAERERAEQALQRRNQELAALNAVSQALSTSLDLQDILDHALSRTIEALGFTGGLIALTDERTGALTLTGHAGLPPALVSELQSQGLDHSACKLIMRPEAPSHIADARHENRPEAQMLLAHHLQAYLGAPILYQERPLGTLCLFDTAPHPISKTDMELLTAIGQQTGVALQNARLFRDVMQKRYESSVLLDTAKALSTTLRLDKLLERVLEELQRIVPYDAVSIRMVRDDRCWTIATRGHGHIPLERFLLTEYPLVEQVVRERGPVIVDDFLASGAADETRACLGVPLVTKDQVVGVLMMDSRQPHTYDENVAARALAFAHQVALAIDNARLYEQAQARLREVTLLHSVTMALSLTLDLEQILPFVARSLCEVLNGSRVEIYDMDKKTGTITLLADYAAHENNHERVPEMREQVYALADLPATAEALAERCPIQVRVDDPAGDPRIQTLLDERGAKATLLLPMAVGDRVLGLAQVWEDKVARRFTEGEIATGQTLAHQAAVAIYNAQLVEALRQHAAELEAQNAELDAFAHTVAHDLKNPLTSLIGYSSLLEARFTRMTEEVLRQNLQIISQNSRRMRNIIDELLLLSSVRKVEEVEMGPLDMAALVNEAKTRLADQIKEHHAEFILPESWPVAMGYRPWVEEAWINYLSNAIKYGGRPPRIEIGASAENGTVRFWVRDNGPGLTPEEQARLFTPFTRLHQARAKGHGLGLSIVRRIIEKLGGEVGVESAGVPGQGSTFYFTLPAALS